MNMLEKAAKALDARLASAGFTSSEDAVLTVLAAIRDVDDDALEAMHNAMFTDPFNATHLVWLGAGFEAAIDAILEGESK